MRGSLIMWTDFLQTRTGVGAEDGSPERAGDILLKTSYATLTRSAALADRSSRALLEVTGKDRAAWLHNLITNEVRNLRMGEGCYAFACNVQGRILFDLNVLVRKEALWIDMDRRFRDTAIKHFARYTITEDVTIADKSDAFARAAICGPDMARVLAGLGATHAGAMALPSLDAIYWDGDSVLIARVEVCGLPCVDIFAPPDRATALWTWLCDPARECPTAPIGNEAVEVRRIEAGLPASGREITEEYLPAETRQLDRAVSFTKGCYLGQEVIERMRSRKVVARLLCGMRLDGDAVPPAGAAIVETDEKPIGSITSACRSVALDRVIALGCVKAASAQPGGRVRVRWEGGEANSEIAGLPFVGSAPH